MQGPKGPPNIPGSVATPEWEKLGPIKCANCDNALFIKMFEMRVMPAILSPTGSAGMAQVEHYVCGACGQETVLSDHMGSPPRAPDDYKGGSGGNGGSTKH